MRVPILPRPAAPVLIGGLALFVAFSGTGYAAATAIDGHRLTSRSVSHLKLIKNTLTGAEIAESTLGKVPRATLADKANHLPAVTLHSFTLGSGWAQNSGFTLRALGYFKDAQGFIHLQGAVTRTSGTGTVIGTLPPGARATDFTYFPIYTAGATFGSIYIASDGSINLFSGDASFVSLEGVVFHADR